MISSTCHLTNVKAVPSSLNFKWLPLSKLQRRVVANEESTAGDLLLASLQVRSSLAHLHLSEQCLTREIVSCLVIPSHFAS